jgi:alpha-glucosidase
LRDLGIDAIWISPCYPSPQVDFGYDVSDYEDIDPMYGTLKDFEHLSHDAKKHDIRIIMDFVLNHSSTQHKWFIDSASSRTSAHRDWYIWRDGKAPGVPPNNWISGFGGSAWQFDSKTGQYYYHFFAVGQADLNWRNPAVETAMFDVTRFWYKRGVSGFRLDAVDLLFEDPNLHDNPVLEGTNELGDPNMQNKYNDKLPEVHVELKKLRRVADENNAVLIGETYTSNRDELKEYYGDHNDEIQMPMDFMFCTVDKLSPADFRAQIANAESTGGWPVYVISNHDMTRSYNRYGDGKHNDQIAKLMAGMYLTLRGTPIMYYGEELGMENNDPVRKEDVKDPIGIAGWPKEKGRDGERTPMQWNDSPYAGFSPTRPWLPVPASFKTHNVDSELADPNSILQFYKRLLALRHHEPALLYGDYVALNQDNPNVLSYLRRYKNEAVLVVLNMSATAQQINFNLSEQGISSAKATTLLTSSANASSGQLDQVTLEPFEVYIARVSQ